MSLDLLTLKIVRAPSVVTITVVVYVPYSFNKWILHNGVGLPIDSISCESEHRDVSISLNVHKRIRAVICRESVRERAICLHLPTLRAYLDRVGRTVYRKRTMRVIDTVGRIEGHVQFIFAIRESI